MYINKTFSGIEFAGRGSEGEPSSEQSQQRAELDRMLSDLAYQLFDTQDVLRVSVNYGAITRYLMTGQISPFLAMVELPKESETRFVPLKDILSQVLAEKAPEMSDEDCARLLGFILQLEQSEDARRQQALSSLNDALLDVHLLPIKRKLSLSGLTIVDHDSFIASLQQAVADRTRVG